jgi:hypothetical protein
LTKAKPVKGFGTGAGIGAGIGAGMILGGCLRKTGDGADFTIGLDCWLEQPTKIIESPIKSRHRLENNENIIFQVSKILHSSRTQYLTGTRAVSAHSNS